MSRIKVLGIGSPFGDDAAGLQVAERLKQDFAEHKHCAIEGHDRPGARLIGLMQGAHTVFLIDAVHSGSPIGTIHRLENEAITGLENRLSTHDLGIAQALELGRSLQELPNRIIFYGIEIGTVGMESVLSPSIQKAICEVHVRLKEELLSLLSL